MEKIRRTEVETRDLPVELTEEELLEYGRELANNLGKIHTLEGELAELKKEFKDRITTVHVEVDRLSTAIGTGQELRAIPCEIVLDFEENKRTVVRTDTNEEIEDGPIPERDRQLEFGDREGVDDNPGGPRFELEEIPEDAVCMTCENKAIAGRAVNREGEVAGFICQACADELEMIAEGDGLFRLPDKENKPLNLVEGSALLEEHNEKPRESIVEPS